MSWDELRLTLPLARDGFETKPLARESFQGRGLVDGSELDALGDEDLPANSFAANVFDDWKPMHRACERSRKSFDCGRSKRGTSLMEFPKCAGNRIAESNALDAERSALVVAWTQLPVFLGNTIHPFVVRGLG